MTPILHVRPMLFTWLMLPMCIAACGTRDNGAAPEKTPTSSAAAAAPTGKIITVEMFSDEKGNRFVPADVEAHPGDVVRFSVGVGVHNVHFLPDSNPGVPNLPEASEMLQLPGQTYDVPVNFAAGKTYKFQCDPHALLGMQGHLKVE